MTLQIYFGRDKEKLLEAMKGEPFAAINAEDKDGKPIGVSDGAAFAANRLAGAVPSALSNLPQPHERIIISHIDNDTMLGVAAAAGCKPDLPNDSVVCEYMHIGNTRGLNAMLDRYLEHAKASPNKNSLTNDIRIAFAMMDGELRYDRPIVTNETRNDGEKYLERFGQIWHDAISMQSGSIHNADELLARTRWLNVDSFHRLYPNEPVIVRASAIPDASFLFAPPPSDIARPTAKICVQLVLGTSEESGTIILRSSEKPEQGQNCLGVLSEMWTGETPTGDATCACTERGFPKSLNDAFCLSERVRDWFRNRPSK